MNRSVLNNITVATKIQNIYDRIGWNITRGDLGSLLSVTSRSVEQFKARVTAVVEKNPDFEKIIDQYWYNLIYSGNKITKIYSFKGRRAELVEIKDYLYSSERRPNVSYWDAFPYPLDNSDLLACDNIQRFHSIKEYALDDRKVDVALFLSAEKYTATFDVEPSHLSESGRALLENSVEIIYRQRAVTQCYNVVIIDIENETLMLSVDFTKLPRTETSKQFAGLGRRIRRSGISLGEPINLFPAISKLYSTDDGRISMVSFITSDGNASSLNLKADQTCLNSDAYHHGGEMASGIITNFKIEKLWNVELKGGNQGAIGVALLGKKAMLDMVSEKLSDAIIIDTTVLRHKMFIIDRLMEALE
ncbi:TPA: hypothetical protein P2R03_004080 [Aeromonas veronii]|nr:hypothetical protein [Aeromonas veronii]